MANKGFDKQETRNIYIILIEDYKLFRRNIGDKNLKHLTDKGYKVFKTGLKACVREKKRFDFINGFCFKLIIFLIPTFIAGFSLYLSYKNSTISINKSNYYNKSQIDSTNNILKKNIEKHEFLLDSLLKINSGAQKYINIKDK